MFLNLKRPPSEFTLWTVELSVFVDLSELVELSELELETYTNNEILVPFRGFRCFKNLRQLSSFTFVHKISPRTPSLIAFTK